MLKKLFVISFLFALGAICVRAQEEINPVKWSLAVEETLKPPNKGDVFNVVLKAEIEKGWHLYALEKTEGGPIATRIFLADETLFELGKIEAPKPLEFDDTSFGVTTKFYEDSVKFILPIKILGKVDSATAKLQLKVRYQTCNDEMCLPPKTVLIQSGFGDQSEDK